MRSFIKICLICIIGINRLKENFTEKPGIYVKLLLAMQLQLKFELILTYTTAAMDNSNFIPPFYIFSLVAILVGIWDHRTQFWKGAIQGPFHQSLVAIGLVVSEEKIKM